VKEPGKKALRRGRRSYWASYQRRSLTWSYWQGGFCPFQGRTFLGEVGAGLRRGGENIENSAVPILRAGELSHYQVPWVKKRPGLDDRGRVINIRREGSE